MRAVFTWISDASYAMYLCHIPTLLLLNRYVLNVDWYNMQTKHSSYMLVYFIGTFAVAGLTRRFWELPWLHYRDRVHPEPGS